MVANVLLYWDSQASVSRENFPNHISKENFQSQEIARTMVLGEGPQQVRK